jgi:hypothetical protein
MRSEYEVETLIIPLEENYISDRITSEYIAGLQYSCNIYPLGSLQHVISWSGIKMQNSSDIVALVNKIIIMVLLIIINNNNNNNNSVVPIKQNLLIEFYVRTCRHH